jgi:hypothetical protein
MCLCLCLYVSVCVCVYIYLSIYMHIYLCIRMYTCTGFQSKFHLALLDMDVGMGTTGCLEGVTSRRLLTNRIDMTPAEAATRNEVRRQHALKMRSDLPDFSVEGHKHVGLEYDRLHGTGYL